MTEKNITKSELRSKPIGDWTEEERQAAEEMEHTVALSYLTTRQIAETGTREQTWDELVTALLDQEEQGQEVGA